MAGVGGVGGVEEEAEVRLVRSGASRAGEKNGDARCVNGWREESAVIDRRYSRKGIPAAGAASTLGPKAATGLRLIAQMTRGLRRRSLTFGLGKN